MNYREIAYALLRATGGRDLSLLWRRKVHDWYLKFCRRHESEFSQGCF
jgi:hypothetical protein